MPALSETVLNALGDPTRRDIVMLLRSRPHSITELAQRLPVSRPAVSKHLTKLRAAELVARQVSGTRHIYTLRHEGFEAARAYLDQFWEVALARYKLLAENLQEFDS